MRKGLLLVVLSLAVTAWATAAPVVDGKVSAGEYTNTKAVLSGNGTLNWAQDAQGGLNVALSVKTKGWAAVGFGAQRMAGASIYLGFVGTGGKAVFSEQMGKGHRHTDSSAATADQSQVSRAGTATIVEFHIAADKLPFTGTSVPFIVAFGDTADLTTFHNDNIDSGTLTLK